MSKPVLLSGVKPTGTIHVGNYLGAIRQFVELKNDHDMYVMIADYHGLNFVQNKEEMQRLTKNLLATYVAIGLNPEEVTIFKQSDVSAHTELTWIFNTITTMPYLMRAHAFKDAEAKSKDISVGTFDYPMLMASDILLYNADVVPVGQDQKQHIEFARDTALKFNNIFGEVLKLPKEMIMEDVAVVPGVDGQKMSKSYNNTIPLLGTDEEIDRAVMSIVSDSTPKGAPLNPETDITFLLHKHFSIDQLDELREQYEAGTIGYKESKELLATNIKNTIAPMRAVYDDLIANEERIDEILEKGKHEAKEVADETLRKVKEAIGVTW